MTADERLEALLNRAGQTISDLPKPSIVSYAYPKDMRRYIPDVAATWHGRLNYGSCDLEDYILHLTDVIDRLETALENVCRERDYLRQTAGVDGCWTCTNSNSGMECHRPEGCVLNDEGRCVGYEYAGVPEDWSADDD